MKWIKRKLKRWLEEDDYMLATAVAQSPRAGNIEFPDPLRFSVQSASGGTVIEVSTYSIKTDRHSFNLHVIPEGKDISECIGKIVTFEMLKRS
jgi:hypothetical protein